MMIEKSGTIRLKDIHIPQGGTPEQQELAQGMVRVNHLYRSALKVAVTQLEILDEEKNLKRKADLFSKRTIRSHRPAEKVDTAVEALALSIGEKAPAPPPAHRIVLSDRQHLAVSGVEGVESFDEATIVLTTSEGSLIVRGEGLHIEKLSLDGGDLLVEGTVESLTYEEEEPHQSFFGRLFRG